MFEVLLLVSGVGAVVCFLKGHSVRGLVTLLLLVGGVAFAVVVQSGYGLLLLPVVAVAAVALGWGRAERGSYWDRHSAVDAEQPRPIDEERVSRRLGRALVGALLGLLPGVLFIAAVGLAVELFDLSGDTAQLAFLGIPITIFGMIGGALIGLQWVPKETRQADNSRETEQV